MRIRTYTIVTCALLVFTFQANAVTWKRSTLTEKREGGRTVVVVVEDAEDANILPRVILRKSFAPSEQGGLTKALTQTHLIQPAKDLVPMTPTNNPLWQVDRQWTEQDEKAYAEWVHKNAAEDMLVGGGILVDCADYAIALRWIFAHDHRLPAGNSLIGGRGLFGSWQSTDVWDKLPTDPDWKRDTRFKAALKYLMNFSFTHSVYLDAYPVAVSPDFVTAGTIYLTLDGESGHTRTLTNVGASSQCTQFPDCMIVIWGNEPADERGYITEFVPYWLPQAEGGLMRFRWPEPTASGWQLRDSKKMPGYSEEQYTFDSAEYVNEIASRLGVWNTPESRMLVAGASAIRLLAQRSAVAKIGYVMCALVPCQPTESIYNDYSTPVRDRALTLAIQSFQSLLKKVNPGSPELWDFKRKHSSAVFAGAPFTIYEFLAGDHVTRLNSDPNADFFARWGLTQPDADESAQGLKDVAIAVWWKRIAMIMDARELCFPNGGTTPACNPADPKVQRLATTRMDQGLRELHNKFLEAYTQASYWIRQHIDKELEKAEVGIQQCGPAHDSECSLYDYFLDQEDLMAKMTSNADSPYLKRMGF